MNEGFALHGSRPGNAQLKCMEKDATLVSQDTKSSAAGITDPCTENICKYNSISAHVPAVGQPKMPFQITNRCPELVLTCAGWGAGLSRPCGSRGSNACCRLSCSKGDIGGATGMKVGADVAAELAECVKPDGPTSAGAAWPSCCTELLTQPSWETLMHVQAMDCGHHMFQVLGAGAHRYGRKEHWALCFSVRPVEAQGHLLLQRGVQERRQRTFHGDLHHQARQSAPFFQARQDLPDSCCRC